MVRSQLLRGEHSFRGVGFVEVDGLLLPVCGSRKFNFSEGATVRWIVEQMQLAKPEETREAVIFFRVVLVGTNITATNIRPTWDGANPKQGTVIGNITMANNCEEGIPRGLRSGLATDPLDGTASLDTVAVLAPFKCQAYNGFESRKFIDSNDANQNYLVYHGDRRMLLEYDPLISGGGIYPNLLAIWL